MISLYVTGVAIALTIWAVILLATLTLRRRTGYKRRPLYVFVIAVAIVWAFILCAVRFSGSDALFKTLSLICSGYALGMLAMYIAMHVYKS